MARRKLTKVELLRKEFDAAHAAEMRIVARASNSNPKSLEAGWKAIERSNKARAAWRAAVDAEAAGGASQAAG